MKTEQALTFVILFLFGVLFTSCAPKAINNGTSVDNQYSETSKISANVIEMKLILSPPHPPIYKSTTDMELINRILKYIDDEPKEKFETPTIFGFGQISIIYKDRRINIEKNQMLIDGVYYNIKENDLYEKLMDIYNNLDCEEEPIDTAKKV